MFSEILISKYISRAVTYMESSFDRFFVKIVAVNVSYRNLSGMYTSKTTDYILVY
jgi:hypothetical protein